MLTVKNAMVYNNISLNTYYFILPKNTSVAIEAGTENHYKIAISAAYGGSPGMVVRGGMKALIFSVLKEPR